MKHSVGLSLKLHFRQPGYTRGATWWHWLLSVDTGQTRHPSWQGYGTNHWNRTRWARLTLLGLSLQIEVEHAWSSWK